MNIFHKVSLQGLKKNRTQTIVTMIGVILSTALITAVASFGISLLDYLAEGAVRKYGGWQVAFQDVDAAFAQERAADKQVTDTVTYENIGCAKLEGGKNPNKPYLFLAGFHQKTFDSLPVMVLSGRLPENSGEVLISAKIATDGGVSYALGDTLSLAVDSMDETKKTEQKTYTVVGICATPVFEQDSLPGYTMITRISEEDLQDKLCLFVTLKDPGQVYSYVKSTAAGHDYFLNYDVLRIMGLSDNPSDRIFNGLLYSCGSIVIVIIMVGSIFLIRNSFSISLNERTQQIGILSSVGATAKQLRGAVLFEGFCIGVLGIPIGVVLGLGGIGTVISFAAGKFEYIFHSDIPLTLHVSILAIGGAAAVSMITILISAYLPARKAAGMPVMECIRQTNDIKIGTRTVKTSKLAQRIYGLEGTLALKNFKRNKRRYRSTVLSLVLSIVLFISTSELTMGMNQMSQRLKVITDFDISFGTREMEDEEMLRLYEQLKNVEDVTGSSYQVFLEDSCAVLAAQLSDKYWELLGTSPAEGMVNLPVEFQFFDDEAYLKIIESLKLSVEEYSGQNGKFIAVAKLPNDKAENASQLPDLFSQDTISVSLASGQDEGTEVSLTLVEMILPDIPAILETQREEEQVTFRVMAPWSVKEKYVPEDLSEHIRVKGLTFQSADPANSEALMKKVIQNAGVTTGYTLFNSAQVLEESRSYTFVINMFVSTFIIMISLIAVANVFNTISTNIKLRRREIAMLRSVGMSNHKLNKMMRFECVFFGMKALLWGLPLAVVCSFLIHKGMFSEEVLFEVPWTSMLLSVISVFLIIFATMMYAVSKIKKENIIDVLRDDVI